jgi:hypothetical protein
MVRSVIFRIAADITMIIHLLFILFVLLGGLLVFRWRWMIFAHLPCVTWAVLLEFYGWICPLTPLEKQLRLAANQDGYSGGFVEHYLLAIIYPSGLTPQIQMIIGGLIIAINLVIYALLGLRYLSHKKTKTAPPLE